VSVAARRTGWILLAALVAAAVVGLSRPDPPAPEGSPGRPSRPAEPARLRAPVPAERSPVASSPSPPPSPLPAEVEEAMRRLVEAVEREGGDVQQAIAALARAVCVVDGGHAEVLRRALDPATDLPAPAGKGAILALGRCEREDALRALVARLLDPATPPDARRTVALALGQRRLPTADVVPDWPAAWIEGATIQGPIAEPFVVAALLEVLKAAGDHPDLHRLRSACVQPLGGTAGDADDVFDALVSSAGTAPERRAEVLNALSLARPTPRVAGHARALATDPSQPEPVLRPAMSLWGHAANREALSWIRTQLLSPETSDARKARAVDAASGIGFFPAEDTPFVELFVADVVAWAKEHPEVATDVRKTSMAEGASYEPVVTDVAFAAGTIALNAYRGARAPSPRLRSLAAEAYVETRLPRSTEWWESRPRARSLSSELGGDGPFLLEVLQRLRTAPLPEAARVAVLDVVSRISPVRGASAEDVAEAAERVAERLSPAAREELDARRRRTAEDPAPSPR
jgi:hypothetical protein